MEIEHLMNPLTILGLPPVRVVAISELGVIQVIDFKSTGLSNIVHTWGDENSSPVFVASLTNRTKDPLLAVARNNYEISVLDPCDGNIMFRKICDPVEGPIKGLHIFNNYTSEPNSTDRSCKLFYCTGTGKADISRYTIGAQPMEMESLKWDVAKASKLLFSNIHEMEKYCILGGSNGALHLCDFEAGKTIWTAAHSATWAEDMSFVCGSFVGAETHELLAGSNFHTVCLYDTRDPKRNQEFALFLEKPGKLADPIRAIARGSISHEVHIGTDSGDLFTLDLRTGKKLYFDGIGTTTLRHTSNHSTYPMVAPSGPIRDLKKHHHHPLIASAGDYCLDIWSTNDRSHMTKVFLKEHLSHVLFDYSSFNMADQLQLQSTEAEQSQAAEAENSQVKEYITYSKRAKRNN